MSKEPLEYHRLAFYSWACVEFRDYDHYLNVGKLRVDILWVNKEIIIMIDDISMYVHFWRSAEAGCAKTPKSPRGSPF